VLRITPDNQTPLGADSRLQTGLMDKVDAACNTLQMLAGHGLKINAPTEEDKQAAATITAAFSSDPAATNKKATVKNVAQLTPPALLLTQQVLKEYSHAIVTSATQIRHLVTNKLIQETENPDPKVRIKALELLGKIGDVGLFTEKTEVTITHQTTDDLRAKLKQRLNALKDVTPADDEPLTIDGEALDLDAILGESQQDQPKEQNALKTTTDDLDDILSSYGEKE
jgi:hypothetical protein